MLLSMMVVQHTAREAAATGTDGAKDGEHSTGASSYQSLGMLVAFP
jgi:hypothetical protein